MNLKLGLTRKLLLLVLAVAPVALHGVGVKKTGKTGSKRMACINAGYTTKTDKIVHCINHYIGNTCKYGKTHQPQNCHCRPSVKIKNAFITGYHAVKSVKIYPGYCVTQLNWLK